MKRLVFVVVVPLFALLAACGGDGDASPTPVPTPAESPTPSPAPATPTPVAPTTQPSPSPPAAATATRAAATVTPARTVLPTATRTSTPRPSPTASVPAAQGRVVSNGPRDVAKIALTFDMGGRVDPALAIMDWLEANSVRATIFMTGAIVRNVNTDAGRQVLGRIAARPDLFDIANHSDTHPDFTTIPASEMVAELAAAEREVARFLKASPRPFFRPPFGAQDADVVAGAAKAGYPVTVMWDVDTIDWRPESEGGPTANEIVTKVLAQAKAGSIVLMHLGGYNTLDALPRIVAGIKERGLQPVTLSDLLGVPQD